MNPTSHVIHEPCDHVDAHIVVVCDWAYEPQTNEDETQTNEAVRIHARAAASRLDSREKREFPLHLMAQWL